MINTYDTLESVVREAYAGVVWTHKIHEKQADIYIKRFNWIENASIFITAITSCSIIAVIFTDPVWVKGVSAFLSFCAIAITCYSKSYNFYKLFILHKATANKLLAVRERYKMLLTEIKLQNDSVDQLIYEHKKLVEETMVIYSNAPSTTDEAVERAGVALKVMEDNTFSENEIDSFLPPSLRRCKHE